MLRMVYVCKEFPFPVGRSFANMVVTFIFSEESISLKTITSPLNYSDRT